MFLKTNDFSFEFCNKKGSEKLAHEFENLTKRYLL